MAGQTFLPRLEIWLVQGEMPVCICAGAADELSRGVAEFHNHTGSAKAYPGGRPTHRMMSRRSMCNDDETTMTASPGWDTQQ